MKIIFIMLIIITSGCVEHECFPSTSYAIQQANDFCSKAHGDKELCESLKINDKVCGISEKNGNVCMALGEGTRAFIRKSYSECKALGAKRCKSVSSCELSFKDPWNMRFADFLTSKP